MYSNEKDVGTASAMSPIASIVADLHHSIRECHERLDRLRGQMEPVLAPSPLGDLPKAPQVPAMNSPMHSSLRDAVLHLETLGARITNLQASLDV